MRPSPAPRLGPESTFWALTTYFNPAGWSARRRNYRAFRRHLELPLLTVELAPPGRHELAAGDAELLVRPRRGDVMWQKERLLNVGLAALPRHVTHVAWLDCDLIFERADWWRDVLAALERDAVVQTFERIVHLDPRESPDRLAAHGEPEFRPHFDREFAVAFLLGGDRRPAILARRLVGRHRSAGGAAAAKGVAWAARRDLIESLGLFDAAIVGGGDSGIVSGFLGDGANYLRGLPESRQRTIGQGYAPWAERAFAATRGRVGSIGGRVFHLWHGDLEDRGYDERHRILEEHAFDPQRDLRRDADGAWLWASAKPELHRRVADYFLSRREDARRADGGGPDTIAGRAEANVSESA